MIPRVAQSGISIGEAGAYYLMDKADHDAWIKQVEADYETEAFSRFGDYALHDKGDRRTAYRVGFTEIMNMEAETPEQAIGQMNASFERYREKEAHKRGRKLRKPLFAYSLSWAPDENPSREEMLDAAQSSLKALRLEGLQTLVVQHLDEPQPHIHVLVNRIERDGSRPRRVSFDKIVLSQWAEQYERDHGGIRCEQRVRNNELRRGGKPVKDLVSLNRRQYEAQERAEKARQDRLRADQDRYRGLVHQKQRGDMAERHRAELAALKAQAATNAERRRAEANAKLRPTWDRLEIRQADVQQELGVRCPRGPLHRAVFIRQHRDLLSSAGPLRKRDMLMMALSGKALTQRVQKAQEKERVQLKDENRKSVEAAIGAVRQEHQIDLHSLQQRQQLEADLLDHTLRSENENVMRSRAAEDLAQAPAAIVLQPPAAPSIGPGGDIAIADAGGFFADTPKARDQFAKAADPARAPEKESDRIRREMREWRKKHPGRDFGLEL
ncbi:MAG: relaxase/mobilization nuclease domain-containing protein [Pseudolabrys sp.]|nr:relaxase/mobilization nuclease domain-containing protein [Pseudolabrys sp.]MCW5696128.1 relaxase/mobilization nuclease domain-containing protein [Bauldia sp.]